MRKLLALGFLISAISACSSSPSSDGGGERDSSSSPSVNRDAEKSQVLSTSKCPKHSKVVNGKCTLQVESDDE